MNVGNPKTAYSYSWVPSGACGEHGACADGQVNSPGLLELHREEEAPAGLGIWDRLTRKGQGLK